MLLAPLLAGPKGCDSAVVGDECPLGTSSASCPDTGDACGGLRGLACDEGEYCNFPSDALCGAADATGVCTDKPGACPLNYDPVCGCDDRTYGNACAAAAAGVSVVRTGACEEPPDAVVCGGFSGAQCDDGEYCNFPTDAACGRTDGTGVCASIPEACDDVLDPVCGCDGTTYANACEAAVAGVSVESSGECAEPPDDDNVCGGLTGAPCERGEFCNFPLDAQCGAADQTGVCAPIPQACDAQYDPVCGCDDKTYGNACEASLAGVSVAASGECPGDPVDPGDTVCGGLRGAQCAEDEYCNFPSDALCGRADATGVCAPKPMGCTKESNPVCGCDGETYGNPCMAAAAGVSVEFKGACERDPGNGMTCGGLLGLQCERGEYCNYPIEAMCGAADQTGVCTVTPAACPTVVDPVCGCDGKNYSNECVAASAGTAAAHKGNCR